MNNLTISVKKRSYTIRIITGLIPFFIISIAIIIGFKLNDIPLNEFPLNLYLSLIPLAILLIGYFGTRHFCKTYITDIMQDSDNLTVHALNKNELKSYNFDLKKIKIVLDTAPMGKGIQYRLQFLEGDQIILMQYGNGFWEGYWTNSILKGVFIRLKDFNKDNHSYVLV